MEECDYNKHLFLLNNSQRNVYTYYSNQNKPECRKCGKSKNIVKVIHSNLSRSLNKVSQLTKEIKIVTNQCTKNKQWTCIKCNYYF